MKSNIILQSANEITFYEVGYEKCISMHNFGPAIREHYIFHFILEGEGFFRCNNVEYNLKTGQGFLITPNQTIHYTAHKSNPWTYMWILVDGKNMEKFFSYFHLSLENPIYETTNILQITDSFFEMHKLSNDDNIFENLSIIYSFFGKLAKFNAYEQENILKPTANYVKQAKAYVMINYHKKLTVDDICKNLNIERTYLFRLFKEFENMSPRDYIIKYRMECAKKILIKSQLTICEVAYSVGYEDQFAFSKQFSKYFGIPPTLLRKNSFL